ncbi:MAG: helix-turn-helix transcriptional regulator [Actinomycetota bacterium]|nr:helix-turn-helix transcriptional regulator [Actinomycetota bacterium]
MSDQAIYVISVAAELAGVHPQTLRVYERKGLLTPQRTAGNTRRYSERDIRLLRRIQELTQEGLNLAGVMKVLELEDEIERHRARHARAVEEMDEMSQRLNDLEDERGRMALVPLKDVRRVRRALKSDAIEQAGRRRTFPAPPAGLSDTNLT